MANTVHTVPLAALLKLDAATCGVMGLVLVTGAAPLAGLTALPEGLLFWAGTLLCPIALFMLASALCRPVPLWAAVFIIAGNGLWVAASLALPLAGLVAPNLLGWALLVVQAGAIMVLLVLEAQAMRLRAVMA